MIAAAELLSPGLQTTIQDAGRNGFRHLGVPRAGAADIVSFALANAAVGNKWNAPCLECTLTGPAIKFVSETRFALGGADMGATLNDFPVPPYTSHDAKKGDKLRLNAAKVGARTYIAFAGGLVGEHFLGSVSTYLPAALGGIEGRALQTADTVYVGDTVPNRPLEIPISLRAAFGHDWILRATPGLEFADFSDEVRARFFSTPFIADQRSNRMGVRLISDNEIRICPNETSPMKSSAVFPGAVQCPPDGAPFLLLADAQTVGGYRRIAEIIEADLPLAGQIRPGDRVWFRQTDSKTAQNTSQERALLLHSVARGFSFH